MFRLVWTTNLWQVKGRQEESYPPVTFITQITVITNSVSEAITPQGLSGRNCDFFQSFIEATVSKTPH